MSLYDNPLPPADYAAYLALREEMCDLALPYLGHCLERQQALREVGRHLESIDFDTATARLGETVCRVQFIGRDVNGRWQWAWDDPPGTYPAEALRDALHLKAYGEQHGIEWLTRSGWPITAYGQEEALQALAVMLNHADGYGTEGALYLLKERLPNPGWGSMLMTVYLPQPMQAPPRSKESITEIVDQIVYILCRSYKTSTAVAAYLDSLPPELHPDAADIEVPPPWRKPAHIDYFPEASTVFSATQPWLEKHLLPLVSFDLASLDPALGDVRLHFIKPVEPYNCYLGDKAWATHTDYCHENWLCFHLEDDGTYRFLAEEDYFIGENAAPDAQKYFAEVRASYQQIKQFYRENGVVVAELDDNNLPRFGGPPSFLPYFYQGNWSTMAPPAAFTTGEDYDDWSKESDIRYQDKRFICIATDAGYNWGEGGADTIFLLYEPHSRLVLMTFDYT